MGADKGVAEKLNKGIEMKVWISRDKGFVGGVEIYTEEPELAGTDYYGPKKRSKCDRSGNIDPELFQSLYGLTPRKGTCKQYELTLTPTGD